jgi:hypothetical protein
MVTPVRIKKSLLISGIASPVQLLLMSNGRARGSSSAQLFCSEECVMRPDNLIDIALKTLQRIIAIAEEGILRRVCYKFGLHRTAITRLLERLEDEIGAVPTRSRRVHKIHRARRQHARLRRNRLVLASFIPEIERFFSSKIRRDSLSRSRMSSPPMPSSILTRAKTTSSTCSTPRSDTVPTGSSSVRFVSRDPGLPRHPEHRSSWVHHYHSRKRHRRCSAPVMPSCDAGLQRRHPDGCGAGDPRLD